MVTGLNPKGVLSPGKYRTPALPAVMEPRQFSMPLFPSNPMIRDSS